RPELLAAIPALDPDRDGSLTPEEAAKAGALLAEALLRPLEVRTSASAWRGPLEEASLAEGDGLLVRAIYRCPGDSRPTSIHAGFVGSLSLGHRHIATASGPGAEPVRAVAFE